MSALPRLAIVAQLRVLLHGVAPRGALPAGRASTGLPALDAWLQGWPRPGIVELAGAPGSGRLAPVLPFMAAVAQGSGGRVLVVDPEQQAHPPGWSGVDPSRVVLIRPPRERAAWAAEQAARSGAADIVLLLDLPPLGRSGLRLARAAEAGGCTVFVVGAAAESELPAVLRLRVDGWASHAAIRLTCTRSRDARMEGGRVVSLVAATSEWS
jgi:hypothetical protein